MAQVWAAWIAIKSISSILKNRLNGFLGIGSAPEFLEKIMWKKFSKKMKKETIKKGVYTFKTWQATNIQLLTN